MKTNTKKGFTLIELLVVIAIIGILSSVVLASLNTARNKGKDASIRSQLSSMKLQAELYYDTTGGTYGSTTALCTGGMFAADTKIAALITKINSDNGAEDDVTCNATASAWAAQAELLGTAGTYVCVDSTGAQKDKVGTHTITDQACD